MSTEPGTTPGPDGEPPGGKSDQIGAPSVFDGACAADAPSVPYEPVPQGTPAQPDGPNVLHTRLGVPLPIDFGTPTQLRGEFRTGDCGRHYFVFTLDRASRLTVFGHSRAEQEPSALDMCFVRPQFLRLDTPWYADIWEKEAYSEPAPPCGAFVPVGDRLEPSDGDTMELGPGSYELTIDPRMGDSEYDLQFDFEPIGGAVCGDGIRDPGEGCDDGDQEPLDWCGADCRPTRLDIEPLPDNETTATAQPLDGFRVVNFYAAPGDKEVDVYSLNLAAGETVELTPGERVCRDTIVQLFGTDGRPLGEPWNCASMSASNAVGATYDGTHYLRFETAPEGARSVSARILP